MKQQNNNRVPSQLRAGIAALLVLTGAGTGVYLTTERAAEEMQRHEYVQAAASDTGTTLAIKIAMVMAAYYESSYRHIGTPYVDKLGKGQPLTVCAGITGAGVVPGKTYTPAECYTLERGRYLSYDRWLSRDLPAWPVLPVFFKASALDFVHNKGAGAFSGSTMRRKTLAGDLLGACEENTRWNRGTVNGVSTVLPGLDVRGKSNAELCTWDDPQLLQDEPPPPAPAAVEATPMPTPAPAAEPARLPWWRRIFSRGEQ